MNSGAQLVLGKNAVIKSVAHYVTRGMDKTTEECRLEGIQ